jgi:hypothetical protein
MHASEKACRSKLLPAGCLSVSLAFGAVAPSSALAAQGDCGQPQSSGVTPVASDALSVLRAAVGANPCPPCVCDVNGNESIAAADALLVLRVAVGAPAVLDCLACRVEGRFGPDGGSLSTGRGTIVIPPGALGQEVTVSLEGGSKSLVPAALNGDGDGRAWIIGPDSLILNAAGTFSVRRDETQLTGSNEIGAPLALLARIEGVKTDFLGHQELEIDKTASTVAAKGKIDTLGVVAVVPLDVHVRLSGVPASPPISDPRTVTVHLDQGASEDVVAVQSTTYIDDDFGSWQPVDGFAIEALLTEVATTTWEDDFDYVCASQAVVNYSVRLETIYDVVADLPEAPAGLLHTTEIVTQIDCHP